MTEKYILTITKTQAEAMMRVFDIFVQAHAGHMDALAESLVGMNFDCADDDPNYEKCFSEYMDTRRNTKIALESAYRIATGDRGVFGMPYKYRTTESTIVQDIRGVIGHQLWLDGGSGDKSCTFSEEPLPASKESLATMCKSSAHEKTIRGLNEMLDRREAFMMMRMGEIQR